MVHKKYIKRDGKIFGPYLYQNYRENGITKTKYLGLAKERKKMQVNLFWIIGIIFLIVLLIGSIGFFVISGKEEFKGELASKSPFNFLTKLFTTSYPVNVFVQIVSNLPPEFLTRPPEILVCENWAVNETLLVKDSLGDSLRFSFYPDLGIRLEFTPKNITATGNPQNITLWTRNLNFNDINRRRISNNGWAIYPEKIIVTDDSLSDFFSTNLVIIEVNDAPKFDIGVKTIDLYLIGENTSFYYDLGSELILNGEETPKSILRYNLTYQSGSVSPFNISKLGVINISGNESYILSGDFTNYPLMVCVNDTGLTGAGVNRILHPETSKCLLDNPPQSADPLGWCDEFILTITKKNRAPNITSYYPLNISSHANTNQSFNRSLKVSGTDVLYFNLTAYDPDLTPLDVYWYVDNVSKDDYNYERLEKNNVSKFEYSFGCEILGNHSIKAVVTDGLLNDSVQWNISVNYVECPKPEPGGGGGGGGKLYCKEKWGCDEWMQCENLYELVEKGWPGKDIELLIKERCNLLNYTKEFCGFQNRICMDFNYCKTKFENPPFLRECYYTKNPNCTDGIKNCHNGSCEVLVDCGGPCEDCPTCHDDILNQGETRTDCGGPCRPCIELPWLPGAFKLIVMYSLIALLIIILLLVARQIMKYTRFRRVFGESRIKNVLIRGGERENKNKNVANVVIGLFFIFFVIVLLFFANAYIINLGQANKIISEVPGAGGAGLLANYGFINSIFNNFGMFFVSGTVINENSKLQIWDDTNDLGENKYSLMNVYFYANYTDKFTGNPVTPVEGGCSIKFQDFSGVYGDSYSMEYDDISKLWRNLSTFNYRGNYDFNVTCTYGAYFNSNKDDFEIKNTAPKISLDYGGSYIDFDGNKLNNDYWACFEDTLCTYDFSKNVTEIDFNDKDSLVYDYSAANTTLLNFSLNKSSGVLEINVTVNESTGDRRIELTVRDLESSIQSGILRVNISPVNDAPQFVDLKDQIFNEGDLFGYTIYVKDEENNAPFKFNVSFVSCSNLSTRGNCTLFNYVPDEINGKIDISFTPTKADVGGYIINFSVMDSSSLGNKTTSQLVNFTVTPILWNNIVQLDYLITEDGNKLINLTKDILPIYQENVSFSYSLINSKFPSFNSSFNLRTGIIDIIPKDSDVGYNKVRITAKRLSISSFRIFNFTVLNVNDSVSIDGITANEKVNISGLKLSTYENTRGAGIYLYLKDDDFEIPQKDFYNENLTINLVIEGPNPNLFKFIKSGMESENPAKYSAEFDTVLGDVGGYNITVNVADANNFSSDVLRFNLTVISMIYNTPNITFPNSSVEFNLIEGIISNLSFRANHSIGDDLNYSFYIDNILRDSFLGRGDDSNVGWLFAPDFTDETYGNEIKNLTLIVSNRYYPNLFKTNITWNLTINHTNALPQLIRDIGDKSTTYNNRIEIDLQNHFTDIDYYDFHYNQSFIFNVTSKENSTNIGWIKGDSDWKIILLPLTQKYTKEILIVTMSDLNGTEILSNTPSNNFTIEFTEPLVITVPTPSGGSSTTIPIALKIIMPGQISAYEGDIIKIPLRLVNSGIKDFNDITLNSSAFKNNSSFNEIKTSLDKTYFKTLKPKQEENLTLTLELGKTKIGKYDILVNAASKSPKYTDWGKIHIDLMPINESQVRDLLIFTEELIASNPQCIEITEILRESDRYLQAGDFANARIKANEALNSCREAISQPYSIPKINIPDFIKSLRLGSYLFLAIIGAVMLAIILGLIYYFIKRREIVKLQKTVQESKGENTKV